MPRDEQGAIALRHGEVVRQEWQPEAVGKLQAWVLRLLSGGDGVQVDGALARGRDGEGGLVEQHDAVWIGLAAHHRGVDRAVLQDVDVHNRRNRRREVRLHGP